jgi:hypothetical protein
MQSVSHRSHMPRVWRFLDRGWWIPATLLAAAATTLACTPAVLTGRPVELPAAYRAKAENPFADTALIPLADPTNFAEFGPWSHGAKLTPRIVPALLLAGVWRLGWHPYLPATAGGIVLLASVIVATARATGDRFVGASAGCAVAGLYASAACFAIPFQPKPFDGVALGIVGLAMLAAVSGPAAGLSAAVALGCLSDERAAVAAVGCAWLAVFSAPAPETLRSRLAAIGAGILAFIAVRLGLGMACGWSRPDGSLLDAGILRHTLPAAGLAARVAFEAAGIPILLLAGLVAGRRTWGFLAGWLATIAVLLASCLVVLDTSRAAAFLVTLVPAAWAGLSFCGLQGGAMRSLSLATAVGCMLLPTLDVIAGVHAIPLDRWLAR